MAKNENTRLPNNHTQYLAKSGYGKTQTLRRRSGIPDTGARVVLWDNNNDHEAHRYKRLSDFFRALSAANKSGRGFRIAYNGEAAPHIFEKWCEGVWSILDGRKLTYCLVEEYSDCCRGPGLLDFGKERYHRRLWTQGRKYGAVLQITSQRPQLISKDSLGNAGVIWAGRMDTSAAERIGKEIDVPWREIMACNVGEFFHKTEREVQKVKVFEPI
ncbi:hypothetical protein [Teredinibacter turnerae]|uniref:hypothetical protein n=1 Tax=Teredinibacter turnerae TaxID=2426 RepID=UPI001F0795F8|nr:hypothetical protein [Teredinibacter turnerae]